MAVGEQGPSNAEAQPDFKHSKRKIRGTDASFTLIQSKGHTIPASPPSVDNAQAGDVYVHEETSTRNYTTWVYGKDGKWEKACQGAAHPNLGSYQLSTDKGRPGWVTRKTLQTYSYRGRSAAAGDVA